MKKVLFIFTLMIIALQLKAVNYTIAIRCVELPWGEGHNGIEILGTPNPTFTSNNPQTGESGWAIIEVAPGTTLTLEPKGAGIKWLHNNGSNESVTVYANSSKELYFYGQETKVIVSGTTKRTNGSIVPNVNLTQGSFPQVQSGPDGNYSVELPYRSNLILQPMVFPREENVITPRFVCLTDIKTNTVQNFIISNPPSGINFQFFTNDVTYFPNFIISQPGLQGVEVYQNNVLMGVTDANGKLNIPATVGNSYNFTFAKNGYRFIAPPTLTVNYQNPVNYEFRALKTFNISGNIKDVNNNPVQGVNMNIYGMSIITNIDGNYSVNLEEEWIGDITPVLNGYTFQPEFAHIIRLKNDTIINFTATSNIANISGVIKDENNNVLDSVLLTGFPSGNIYTNASGQYNVSITKGWSGNLLASKNSYIFTPDTVLITNINNDSVINIAAFKTNVIVSGEIKDAANNPILNVKLSGFPNGDIYTNSDGFYSIIVDKSWSGNITVSKDLFTFTPDNITLSNLLKDTILNFEASLKTYQISGIIKDSSNNMISNVVITGFPSGSIMTNQFGEYSATVNYGWSGIIKAQKNTFAFKPDSIVFNNINSNTNNQNFQAIPLFAIIKGVVTNIDNSTCKNFEIFLSNTANTNVQIVDSAYILTVPLNWTGNVLIQKASFTFAPSFRNYSNVITDIENQDFTATPNSTNIANDYKSKTLSIWPNPCKNFVNIMFSNINNNINSNVLIFNQFGKLAMQFENIEINDNIIGLDLSNLSNGVYYIQIITPDSTRTSKIMKVK